MKQRVVYSEAFKLRVLRAVETGEVSSINAAQEVFGIRGNNTIKKWVMKYGKNHLLGKVIRVQTPKETSELQMLRKRVRDLEKALANKTIDCLMGEAYLQIACDMAQVSDLEAFKKNTLASCKLLFGCGAIAQDMHNEFLRSRRHESPKLLRGAQAEATP